MQPDPMLLRPEQVTAMPSSCRMDPLFPAQQQRQNPLLPAGHPSRAPPATRTLAWTKWGNMGGPLGHTALQEDQCRVMALHSRTSLQPCIAGHTVQTRGTPHMDLRLVLSLAPPPIVPAVHSNSLSHSLPPCLDPATPTTPWRSSRSLGPLPLCHAAATVATCGAKRCHHHRHLSCNALNPNVLGPPKSQPPSPLLQKLPSDASGVPVVEVEEAQERELEGASWG
mmetsp:Transcript_18308/g.47774  ORF Transcript_18308/g.47774 Transcript_18308/m.47774 type:complete len:225 (+) Transcript_18308:155-829(+)